MKAIKMNKWFKKKNWYPNRINWMQYCWIEMVEMIIAQVRVGGETSAMWRRKVWCKKVNPQPNHTEHSNSPPISLHSRTLFPWNGGWQACMKNGKVEGKERLCLNFSGVGKLGRKRKDWTVCHHHHKMQLRLTFKQFKSKMANEVVQILKGTKRVAWQVNYRKYKSFECIENDLKFIEQDQLVPQFESVSISCWLYEKSTNFGKVMHFSSYWEWQ